MEEEWFVCRWSDNGCQFGYFTPVKGSRFDTTTLGMPFIYVKARNAQEALGKLINHILDVYQERLEVLNTVGFCLRRKGYDGKGFNFDLRKLGNKDDIRLGSFKEK